jgi:hypothetical protein
MNTLHRKVFISLFIFSAGTACKQSTQEEEQKRNAIEQENRLTEIKTDGVYFANLKNGEKVKSPFIIKMGVSGMKVAPAGILDPRKGHHHLIIDGSFVEKGKIVPKDESHLHFGKGQTIDTLTLSPGQHTLTLQFADGLHQSYGKDWSSSIQVTVEK